MPKAEIDRQVRDTARMLHIDHLLDRLPAALSGGQQQRLAIARALVKKAKLLLLDEPLVNLDYKLREELRAELRDLFARQQTTVVYATTEPLEALIMGGEVIVMDEGRVLQTGPTVEVYHRPGSLRVAAVFSDPPMNMMAVTRRGTALAAWPQRRRAAADPAPRQACRRGAAYAGRTGEPPVDAPHGTNATSRSTRRSSWPRSRARRPSSTSAMATSHWVVQEEGVHEHALGQAVQVHLDPARLYAFDRGGALELAPVAPGSGRLSGRHGEDRASRRSAIPTSPTRRDRRTTRSSRLQFAFEDGGAYALLGPSGCGKTTLLNIISGLLQPSEGRVLFDRRDVTRLTPAQRNIAQVFQFPVIYDTMTVGENLAFPLRNRGVPEPRDHSRASPRSPRCSISSR